MDYYSAFPFYMGYQGYGQWAQPGMVQEDRILEDLEYLQQMYPTYARKYQSVISSVVDKMDYEGSFIYDQYPDKLTMQRMVDSVMAVIKSNEDTQKPMPVQRDELPPMMLENVIQNAVQGMTEQDAAIQSRMDRMPQKGVLTENAPWREKEPWIRELVTVLMCYEILKRRRKNTRHNYYQF